MKRLNCFLNGKFAFNNEPPVPPVPPVPPPPPTAFNAEQQKIFDNALAVERRKAQEKNETLIKQLEQVQKSKGLSDEEREALAAQVENLRTEGMTKEQLAADQLKKTTTQFENEKKTLLEERDNWKNTFQTTLAQTEILKAGATPETEVYDGEQILEILGPKAKVVPVIDPETNKPTGKYAVKIALAFVDDKGESKTLELSPLDALKKMKEMPRYQNQFKSAIKGGLGDSNIPGNTSDQNLEEIAKDPAKWKEYRTKNGFTNNV